MDRLSVLRGGAQEELWARPEAGVREWKVPREALCVSCFPTLYTQERRMHGWGL